MLLQKSTIQLLRFRFSFFLMPVFWFALGSVPEIHLLRSLGIFLVIHLILYPSSNGYNSFMDRDTDSIGGIRHPMEPTKELYYVTLGMDLLAILLAVLLSTAFAGLLLCYIICSRLYSYRGIRLKKYPIMGYLIVILNQGGIVFLMVYLGAGDYRPAFSQLPWLGIGAACMLIGGFYPITQVYQHLQDEKDGVTTLSRMLGIRG
ncbi:MAG: UbiA prenyltransferase family protein, partial [Bacteroidota bacterium]|nr:UbiA prenyltransferase family protein [Bacteroidota bacterium]